MNVDERAELDVDRNLLEERPLRWDLILHQLTNDPQIFVSNDGLTILRRRLECDGAPIEVLRQLASSYPREFAFSILLCTLRFPGLYSEELMGTLLDANQRFKDDIIDYLSRKFNGGKLLKSDDSIIIGEALALLFSFFDDFIASSGSGNLDSIKHIRRHYPDAILYADVHSFNALHGVCGAMNTRLIQYLVLWHLEREPNGRGGLYEMNDSGITAVDTLLDTQQDITPTLTWLRRHDLLSSFDVQKWLLVHRAAHSSSISTIRFFLNLLPSGSNVMDDDGNLPLHLHISLRYRRTNTFSDDDLEIVRLLVIHSIDYGGLVTFGGLFHQDPDDETSCTLKMLLDEAGEANAERIWQTVTDCLNEVGEYSNAPIVHLAILNKDHIPTEIFKEVLVRFGASSRNEQGDLPLTYSARVGMKWEEGVSDILEMNRDAMTEVENESNLPSFLFAASKKADLSTIYYFILRNLTYFTS